MQKYNSQFHYVMNLIDESCLQNVFWKIQDVGLHMNIFANHNFLHHLFDK
jgi:hypothetical protein